MHLSRPGLFQRSVAIAAMATFSGVFPMSPLPAKSESVLQLKPSSNWHMHYADDSCRIMRTFGEGRQKVAFYLERFEPGDNFSMLVAGRPFRSISKREYAFVRFGEGQVTTRLNFTNGSLPDFESAMIFGGTWFGAQPTDGDKISKPKTQKDVFSQIFAPDAESAIEWISVKRPNQKAVVLETGSMGRPMVAMRQCTDRLLTRWGVDIEKHRDLASRVKPANNPGRWVRASEYPSDLLSKGQQGIVHFRLSVDSHGSPTECHIQKSTRPEGFDKAVCDALMRRARFEPAKTRDGESIASYWRSAARFEISR